VLRKDGVEVSTGVADATYMIDTFDNEDVGTYDCLAENPIGRALSEGLRLDRETSPGSAPIISQLESTPQIPVLGTTVTLTCDFSTQGSVTWYLNGMQLNDDGNVTVMSPSSSSATLRINNFMQPGVYQCCVSNGNGDNSIMGVAVCGTDGTPGSVDTLFAIADTKTSINVSWFPPAITNTNDPLLLRYFVLSHAGDTFSFDSAEYSSRIAPTVDGGSLSTILEDLSPGTRYAVALRAQSSSANGSNPLFYGTVSTYGNAPSSVQNLILKRTPDNDTLVAFWTLVIATPPVGRVVRYEIQFRDQGLLTNTVIQSSVFNYTVLHPVANASSYEVRVRASVEIQRDPVEYESSPWTEWESVSSVIDPSSVPPVPPTGGIDRNLAAVVTPAVVIPTLVVGLIVSLVVVIVVFKFCHGGNSSNKSRYLSAC